METAVESGSPVELATSSDTGSLKRPRFHFLDGVRGLAALYVTYTHVWILSFYAYGRSQEPTWFRLFDIFKFGHDAVSVFIVLSGFCLMLPVAASGSLKVRGTVTDFLLRRARRILPPYYAALFFSCLGVCFVPALRHITGSPIGLNPGKQWLGPFVSHLFLVHNLNTDWAFRFDGPMWSVATEWQIYFLFPLFLLPVARKFGLPGAVVAGFTVGCVSLLPRYCVACFWFTGSFAVGMLAAQIAMTCETGPLSTRKWGGLCAGTWFLWAISSWIRLKYLQQLPIEAQLLCDIMATCGSGTLLIYMAFQARNLSTSGLRPGLLFKVLSSRLASWIGGFSYSIYLVHLPLLTAAAYIAINATRSMPTLFFALAILAVPVVGIAYLFHLVFEKPFMPKWEKTARQP
jgi:peptidoglycan/LPS O-acetylase OafA/YrhL